LKCYYMSFLNVSDLPKSVFVGLGVDEKKIYFAVGREESYQIIELERNSEYLDQEVYEWLENYPKEKNLKIIAAGIGESSQVSSLGEKLWLDLDIVPFLQRGKGENVRQRAENLAKYTFSQFKVKEGLDIAKVDMSHDRQVHPAFLTTLEAYKQSSSSENFQKLMNESKRFRTLGGKIMFINSTPQGGGVALMRHAQMRLYKELGVEASWVVMTPKLDVFDVTKKRFHNVLQGVSPAGVFLREKDKNLYTEWAEENGKILAGSFKKANVIIIDDWQPSGLIKKIKEVNPTVKIIFRSHIHVDTTLFKDNSPQKITWDFVWDHNRIKEVDVFISHPIPGFVPEMVPQEKVVLMPATTDPLDGLNKPLNRDQMNYYLAQFNQVLDEGGKHTPLDLARPYIVQIARFDPSKGIPDVLESYRMLRKKLAKDGVDLKDTPQLVICGHGAVDDPEGVPILEETEMTISVDKYKNIKNDIKIARLPHNDQILNAVLRGSKVAMQLSHKEGCEVKVTESLHKGKPIIIYNSGGMHLQVENEVNSFVVPVGNTEDVAEHLYNLCTNEELYTKMSKKAKEKAKEDFLTVNNCYKWLFLANELLEKGYVRGNGNNIKFLMEQTRKSVVKSEKEPIKVGAFS
jgi:alpha,alpha-trehalose phosphorylase (configuration-retaining)